ncbi:hypothetical protein [Streptomyces sp. NPDC001135]
MTRKAFKTAQRERPGAVFLAVPEDIEADRRSPRSPSPGGALPSWKSARPG